MDAYTKIGRPYYRCPACDSTRTEWDVSCSDEFHTSILDLDSIRPEVMDFAIRMEKRLREKDAEHPDGWEKDTDAEIPLARAADKILYPDKFRLCWSKALQSTHTSAEINSRLAEIVDAANYCMIADSIARKVFKEKI
jgi:hypothetical protein